MTKEELYGYFTEGAVPVIEERKEFLDEFFESNVFIPKGENRHPYADVLHEWIEGVPCEYRNPSEPLGFTGWYDMELQKMFEYRIKPSDLVYEYQYLRIDGDKAYPTDDFLTEDEAIVLGLKIRLEDTKKPRT